MSNPLLEDSKARLKAVLGSSDSQHLSEDALKNAWQQAQDVWRQARAFVEQQLQAQPLLADLVQRALPLLGALFVLSTVAGVLSASYWSQRDSIAANEFARARGLNAQGQHERALRYLRSAAHLDHHNREYQMELAVTLIELGRFDEARLQLNALLRDDPTDAETNLRLARIAAEAGENGVEVALQYYQRAIYGMWQVDPTENRIRTRFELVHFLALHQRLALLRAELIVLASDLRDDPDQLEQTGFLLLHAQSPENAVPVFERLLSSAPGDVRGMGGLGKAYLELGNYMQAEQWLRRALRLNPQNLVIHEELEKVREVRAMDPQQRGLSRALQTKRANQLLIMNYHPLFVCSTRRLLPEEVNQDLLLARARLLEKPGRVPQEGEAQRDISFSKQLYGHYSVHCEAEAQPETVRRLMALLETN